MGVQIREDRFGVASFTLDANITETNTTQEVDVTIPGLRPGMFVAVNKPSHSAGIGIVNARVKSADTLSITYVNATGSGVDPGSETYLLFWFRPETTVSGRVNP
jgi:hypothetical protein